MRRDCNGITRRLVIGLMVALSVSLSSAHMNAARAQGNVVAHLPDGELGVFKPSTHGFRLTNAQLSKQIVQWFTLKGEDEDISELEKEVLLSELFHPDDLCINSLNEADCALKPAAIKWIDNQIKSMENGVCEGMIVASLALWKARQDQEELLADALADFDVDVDDYVRLLAGDEETLVGDIVTYGFTSQLVDSVARPAEASRNERPSALRKKIYTSIRRYQDGARGPEVDLYTIGMYRVEKGDLKEGHSVMPYKVTDEGNGVYRVYVYDANHPMDDGLYIEFKGDEWTYAQQRLSYSTSKSLELTPWVVRNFHKERYFACPYCAPSEPLPATTEVWLAGEGELTISDTAGVILAGYDDTKDEYVAAPAVTKTPFKGGLNEDVPDRYQLPASETGYRIRIDDPFGGGNEAREKVDLVLSTAGIYMVMEDLDLAPNGLIVSVKNTAAGPIVWIEGGPTGVFIPSVFLVEDGDNDSYEVELSDVEVPRGTRLAIGLAKGHHQLIFSPTSTGKVEPAAFMPYDIVAVRVDNALNEYVMEVPEVLVGLKETVVFDLKNWDAVNSKMSAAELPITIWEGVDISDIFVPAATFPEGGKKLTAQRAPKNNKSLKRHRRKTIKAKPSRRRRI